jgi:tetratricopeptide (TPR) repeat protein
MARRDANQLALWSIAAMAIAIAVTAGCGTSRRAAGGSGPVKAAVLPAAKPEARVHFEEGVHQMEVPGGGEKAIAAFTRAIKADSHLFEAWHDRGIVEARLGRWASAADSLDRALELQPGSRATVFALANVLLRAHRAGEAVTLLERQLRGADANGDDAGEASSTGSADARAATEELRLFYVQALREAGKTSRALEEVEKVLVQSGRSGRAFNALGLVYYRMEKPALAETALRRAAELDPKSAEIWNNLGLVALARGHDHDAFAAFDKAVALDDGFLAARLNKAAVLLDCGDYAHALPELEAAAKAHPDDVDVLVALGVAKRGLGKPEEAREAYEGALALAPESPAAHFNLGVLFMDFLPDKKKAREHLRLYRKVAPSADARQKEAESRLKELR